MSCKSIILYATYCIYSIGVAGTVSAQSAKKSYDRSVFNNYQSLPVNKNAPAGFRKNANLEFPGWAVTTDKLSGYVTDVYGKPMEITGNNDLERSQNCLAQKLTKLGINKAEWKKVSEPQARKANYVYYSQAINGHPVVFAQLSFRYAKTGELTRIQMKNYGSAKGNITPALTKDEAKTIAQKDLVDETITSAKVDDNWSWFPVPSATGYELHPAWHFEIKGKLQGHVPLILTGYVDAKTGELLLRTNNVKETSYDLTVKGMVYKNGTLLPPTLEPLSYLSLNIGSSTYTTDPVGHFATGSILLPASTSIPLAGQWSTVFDDPTSVTPVFTDLVSIPGTTYSYPALAPSSSRHVNAYYHVNRVHDFMKNYFPTFTDLDFSLPTNVDLTSGVCNAYYSGTDINFYAAGSGCNSFAELGDVVYHEYGHGISDHFYTFITGGSIFNGALNEANSDIWAISITHNPIIAANAFTPYGGFIRRYDLLPQIYPVDLDLGLSGYPDPHKNGQIIAGSWCDVAVNLASFDTMTQLFTDVYYDAPDGPPGTEGAIYQSILIDALMADDDNSNLFDGTPHYAKIVAAFAKHGIYLEQDATITHTDKTIQTSGTPITVTASLAIGATTYFHDLTMYYRINGTGAWTPAVMTNSAFTFTGTIPAQTAGTTVEYYFAMHDALNVANGYFPVTYNPTLPAEQSNITYQFGVGIHRATGNNFDAAPVTGWTIGGNPGDDATVGKWIQLAPSFGSYWIFPTSDHTTGSGQCLATGDGVSDTGVNYGTTTVLTPVFDISTYTNPVVEYYRWFSNEQGLSNFKNDPWEVKIRDASLSTWQSVEKTYQADPSWRRRMFRVSQFLTSPSHIQLKFFASDSVVSSWNKNGQGLTMGSIDDFYIYDQGYPLSTPTEPRLKAEIYPNPADDRVQVVLAGMNSGTIALYDMLGKKVSETPIEQNNNSYSIDTRSFGSGQYNLVIQTSSSIQSKKIVVVHN